MAMASSLAKRALPPNHTLHRQTQHPSSPPHILLLAFPAQGHIIPLLNLADLLASRGVAVTFVCIQQRISQLQRDRASALHPLIRLVGLPERIPLGELGIDEGIGITVWYAEVAAEMENDVVQLIHELRAVPAPCKSSKESLRGAPILVVYDAFLWWMHDVAVNLRMNYSVFVPSCASSLSLLLSITPLVSHGFDASQTSSAEPTNITLLGLAPTWHTELFPTLRNQCALQALLDTASKLAESSSIVINTCYELEANVIDALQKLHLNETKINIHALGPLFPLQILEDSYDVDPYQQEDMNTRQEEVECLRWLSSQSPASVLYVSFGTICIPSLEAITELALGLEASSHPFLWVLRAPPSVASRHAENFSLSKLLPEGFESRTKNRAFISSSWVPQLSVLSHPSVGSFLTHCGWNSVLESIWCGVPLIAYPQFADSSWICKLIVDEWKIGIRLRNDENECLRKEEVEKAVKIVMEGEEGKSLKKNVLQLSNIARRSLKEDGSTRTNVQEFVDKLFQLQAHSA